ncbi:MAG: hypothetical protein KAT79_00975 [candidate division Zixibacteria bacterium]|nr:hypothetical protein [candidate division Zixibacteria bacterium]
MTVEVAIMNQSAIALAADSAVTIGDPRNPKIFNSVNKLFTLSKYEPVGIMVFGNARFMNMPWETIVKLYRNELQETKFPSIREYAEDFVKFLTRRNRLFTDDIQSETIERVLSFCYDQVLRDIISSVGNSSKEGQELSPNDIKAIVTHEVEKHAAAVRELPDLPRDNCPRPSVLKKSYGAVFDQVRELIFEQLPMSASTEKKLIELGVNLWSKDWFSPFHSGVVVAGFGENEVFPGLTEILLDGIAANVLKFKVARNLVVDHSTLGAAIVPFADTDVIRGFMDGISYDVAEHIADFLKDLLGEYHNKIGEQIAHKKDSEAKKLETTFATITEGQLERFRKSLQEISQKKHSANIINAVSILPKDELASMAEALVNLTSFKKRISFDKETVGGPIDVAVISKGDGLVWIRRKHYFDKDLNHHFLANYYRDRSNDGGSENGS